MRRSTRVVLDPFNRVLARCVAVEIDDPDPAFGPVAAVADPDLAAVVAAADVLAFTREGEGEVGAAFVEVVVHGAAEMSDTRCSRFVGAELEGGFGGIFGADGGFVGVDFGGAGGCCYGGWRRVVDCLSFGIVTEGGVGEEGTEALSLTKTYPWLKHFRIGCARSTG